MPNPRQKKLLLKLQAMIAVIKVAMQKVEGMRDQPDADSNRIDRIEHNLKATLGLCNRAIEAIQLVGDMHIPGPSGSREYSEMMGIEEYQKFKGLPPITEAEVSDTDLDDLINRLQQ